MASALALYGARPELGRHGARRSSAASRLASSLALAIGLFSLRVQAIFFAMVTLAVAYAFNVLASQLSWLTGGEDGRSFQVPEVLRPGFKLVRRRCLRPCDQRAHAELLSVFACCAALFLVLLRIVNSPFGRVLQAIRENPFRAEALGYRIVVPSHAGDLRLGRRRDASAGALNAHLAALRRARHRAERSRSRSTCWSSS